MIKLINKKNNFTDFWLAEIVQLDAGVFKLLTVKTWPYFLGHRVSMHLYQVSNTAHYKCY